jgi:hypothetical protein
MDALLCWPEIELTNPSPTSIESHAGWTNGTWTSNLVRTVYRGQDFGFDPPDGQWEKPYVERLDAVAPEWRFIDVPQMNGQADIGGVEWISPGQFLLSRDKPLTGFQSSMPHLIRSDGRSVIFPAGYRPHSKHDFADAWFLLWMKKYSSTSRRLPASLISIFICRGSIHPHALGFVGVIAMTLGSLADCPPIYSFNASPDTPLAHANR